MMDGGGIVGGLAGGGLPGAMLGAGIGSVGGYAVAKGIK